MPKQRVFEKVKSFVNDATSKVKGKIIDIIQMRGDGIPETSTVKECVTRLLEIMAQTGDLHPEDGTATAGDVLSGEKAYSKDGAIIGTIQRKNAQTYTPGTVDQTIAAGQYLSGAQTVKGDANLKPENIIKGKSIFGVDGGFDGLDMSDATATAGDIVAPYSAYVNGEKIVGQIATVNQTTYTPRTTDQTISQGYYVASNIKIKGDSNLKPENIAKGKSIFGVAGTCDAQTFYECTAVSGDTWSGKKLVLDADGNYSISNTVTSGLSCSGFTPQVGEIYNANTCIVVQNYFSNLPPTDGLVFYASLNGKTPNVAETGQTLTEVNYDANQWQLKYGSEDGIPCAIFADAYYGADAGYCGLTFDASTLPQGSSVRTISLWVKCKNYNGSYCFAYGNYSRGNFVGIQGYSNANSVNFTYHGDDNYSYGFDFTDRLHHVVMVFKGSTNNDITYYFDGVEQEMTRLATGISINTSGDTCYLGCGRSGEYQRFDGWLSSIRVYDRVLMPNEIAALASEFTPTNA